MTDDNELVPTKHYIACARKGGTRCAACCVIFDRYKICRKYCDSLKKHLKEHPDLVEKAKQHFEDRKIQNINKGGLFHIGDQGRFAGRNLPNCENVCQVCGYAAKSPRGLKSHLTRSHKRRIVL